MATRIGVRLLLLVLMIATIGCDRVTKHIAATTLSEAPSRSFAGDTFRLDYAENTGAFLSLGANWPPRVRTAVFSGGSGLLLVVLGVVAIRSGWPRQALVGVALFVAGGASNLFDRITDGVVIDFMNVGIGSLRTGIFNVADMAIMLGATILVVEGWWRRASVTAAGPPRSS